MWPYVSILEIGAVSVRSLTLFIESKTGVNISTHSIRRFGQKTPTDSKISPNIKSRWILQ